MQIDWWTLGLQAGNALILVWILGRFLFKPVAAMIAEREAAIKKRLDDAEAVKAEALAARQQAAEEVKRLSGSRGEMLRAASEEGKAEKDAMLAEARAEAAKLRAAAESDIAQMRGRAENQLADRASLLAVDIAGKLLARLPQSALVTGFLDGIAEGLRDLPETTRAGLGRDGPVTLTAARELAADELEACRAMLAKALGRTVAVTVTVDPGLVAGLELHSEHAVVRNSLKADLERIAQDLTDDGSTR